MAVSPLGAARLRRRLTVEEAAARAQMEIDQVKSLEENCMYRFGSNADALAAALVYATALGISEREARQIAGLPVGSRLVDPWSLRRTMAIAAFLAAVGTLVWFGFRPELGADSTPAATPATQAPALVTTLPEPWEIDVDVYNGTQAGNAAASLANRVAGLAYRIAESGYRLDIPRMFAALWLLSVVGVAIFFALTFLSQLLLRRWHESALQPEG